MPGATVARTLACIQDYDNHKKLYRPEVIDSKLIARHGDDFQIYLRVLKKKIITVVLDTDHDVHYFHAGGARWGCRSYTTRTAEVDDAGKPNEKIQPPDAGYGFLWRLNTYWRFEERDGGVFAECRAISLTRDIPSVSEVGHRAHGTQSAQGYVDAYPESHARRRGAGGCIKTAC